jgi:hypothetical protein
VDPDPDSPLLGESEIEPVIALSSKMFFFNVHADFRLSKLSSLPFALFKFVFLPFLKLHPNMQQESDIQ